MTTRMQVQSRFLASLVGACSLCGLAAASAPPPPDAMDATDAWMYVRNRTNGQATEDPPAITGAHLILRHAGRPLATAYALDRAQPDPLLTATESLLSRAARRLDAMNIPRPLAAEALKRAAIDVETAGPLVPITAPTLELAARELDPARDGIALRVEDAWHIRFPAALRMTGGAATASALLELAAVVGRTPAELDTDRRLGRAAIYRFRTIDLRQAADDRLPSIFERGATTESWNPTVQDVALLRRSIGQHLLRHLQTGEKGELWLAGAYHPESDSWTPVKADSRDTAIALLAFDRLRNDPELGRRSQLALIELLRTIDRSDDIVAAICSSIEGEPDSTMLLGRLASPQTSEMDKAILAWALAPHFSEQTQFTNWMRSLETMSQTQIDQLQPWAGWVYARSGAGSDPSWGPALVERVRVRMKPSGPWINAGYGAPLLRLAASLPAIDHDETALKLALGMVHALTMKPSEVRFLPSPDAALGGVREAMWNERMPVWVQSLAILLLDDTLQLETRLYGPVEEDSP